MRRPIKWGIGVVVGLVVLIFAGLFVSVRVIEMRAFDLDISDPKVNGAPSVILANDNKTTLGRLAVDGNHTQLNESQITSLIEQVTLAAEDRDYYARPTVSTIRLALEAATIARTKFQAGGSGITQQYAKNAYGLLSLPTRDRKLAELEYSYRLEKKYTKRQILTRYLNTICYGRGSCGIGDAAKIWFGVDATTLNNKKDPLQVARSAFLIAMVNRPGNGPDGFSRYEGRPSNLVNSAALYARVRYVLDGLGKLDPSYVGELVSQSVIDRAKQLLPLKLTDSVYQGGSSGNPQFVQYIHSWLAEQQVQALKDTGYSDEEATKQGQNAAESMLARGGLRIVTKIAPQAQNALNKAAKSWTTRKGLATGAVIIDPKTGAVVAMYSGQANKNDQNNYVLAERRVGSTMKTVVLTNMVDEGISVKSEVPVPAYVVMNGSKIWNDDRRAAPGCRLNVVDTIAHSSNVASVQWATGQMVRKGCAATELLPISDGYPVNIRSVAEYTHKMGGDASLVPGRANPAKLEDVPTLALGVNLLSPLKMGSIVSTLANRGEHHSPFLIESVTASDGTVLYRHEDESKRVIDSSKADIVNQVQTKVFTHGTAINAQVKGHPLAGKTGTTEITVNAMAYNADDPTGRVPTFACAAQGGYPDNRETSGLWGSDIMKICSKFFAQILKGKPRINFPVADMDAGEIVGLNAKERRTTTDTSSPSVTPTEATASEETAQPEPPAESPVMPNDTPTRRHRPTSTLPPSPTAEPTEPVQLPVEPSSSPDSTFTLPPAQ
jgi:membrane peptidoglycan carboxypeptidase